MNPTSIFILGPSVDNVTEPIRDDDQATTETTPPARREVALDEPATRPGGVVNLKLLPATGDDQALPVAVHAIYVQPAGKVPVPDQRQPEWFFQNATASATFDPSKVGEDGKFSITVPGVKPSIDPYFVQTILEFRSES